MSQASKGLIFNVRFCRTLRASSQVVGLANRNCPTICTSRPVTAYIMPHVVLDQLKGFPVPSTSLSNPYDDRPAKIYFCRAEELPTHFKMHSFGVEGSPSTVLTGAAVDEIMKTGGWKTESTA